MDFKFQLAGESVNIQISPVQFSCFRIFFGLYLAWHFAELLPYAAELFCGHGILASPKLNPTYGLFPNPLYLWDSPAVAKSFVAAGVVLSLLFSAGWKRPWTAVLLWFVWACLFHRNNLISNPSIPYVGLLLLLSALVPCGEPWSLPEPKSKTWQFPPMIYWSAWGLMAAGYTFSGWHKLGSPSWIDGTALWHVLENPLARPGMLRDFILGLPETVLHLMTWSVLVMELAFLPASWWNWSRAGLWFGMGSMHLGIMLLVNFSDLSLGMLALHAFTLDPRWLPRFFLQKLNFQYNLKIQKI